MNSDRAFIFAGGGTGGHIYPAIAIIEQLRVINPDVCVHILCSNRPIDSEILAEHDVSYSALEAMPVSKKPTGMLRFMKGWGPSVRKTREQIRALQSHDGSKKQSVAQSVTLVALGGFVAAPATRGALAERCPVVLVNLDAVPGKANRMIARKASMVFTATDVRGFEDWKRVRPIVRSQTIQTKRDSSRSDALAEFGLKPDFKTLLITGGSQGAVSINRFIKSLVKADSGCFGGWQVIHQVGSRMSDHELKELKATYSKANIPAWCDRYISSMGPALASADLAMGRCGAGSVAECWAAKLPSMFFPYPYHKDEHQKHNASVLVDAGCAVVCDDLIDPVLNVDAYQERLRDLLSSDQDLEQMRAGYESLGVPDGAQEIAMGLLKG
jgi:UDP-N-acetylglucosamine--N-acetylmuramyl-(pentapeptide) pyrophosphoryl-undecaprenol N-acetylglucosamine transferase